VTTNCEFFYKVCNR